MGLFSGPNKFLVQEALEIGISNLEKSRRVDTKKLYEEVKAALADESSPEMQNLYKRYISLYEAGLKTSTEASTTLKDEVKWKHLGDLREAVKSGGQGLSLADIEGLNQFALAEHGRQDRYDNPQRDEAAVALLKDWFRMYEILKQKSIESMKASYKDALRSAFLTATSTPFTFRYSEGNNILELSVTFKDNKIVIGSKEHALIGEKIKVGSISMDKDQLYIPFTIDGKDTTYSEPIKKKEFLDKYLQDILDGKDIRIQGNLVRVSRTGEFSPRVLVEGPIVPRAQAEIQRETLSLDEAIKKGFMSLVSGKKSEPLTVLQDGKKYRFPLEVDQNSFTLGGKRFDFTFPSDIKRGSFEFSNDAIIFSGILRGENQVKSLFEVKKNEVAKQLSGSKNEIGFSFDGVGRIMARGRGEYLSSSAEVNAPSSPSPVGREGVKYGLKELEGYTKEKLALYGKDIGALQSALKAKKFYNGDITGVYDMATLDAVLAFQKTIKNSEFGADGLVGKETISALFGIPPLSNNPPSVPPVAPVPAPGAPSGSPLPTPVPGVRPAPGIPSAPRPAVSQAPGTTSIAQLSDAIISFRKVIQANDTLVSGGEGFEKVKRLIPTSESTIQTSAQAIEIAYKTIETLISQIDPNKLSDKDRVLFNAYVLEVARYYADEHSVYAGVGVENRHWKNYPRSLELTGSMLKSLFIKEKIHIDPPPTDGEIRSKMKDIDPATAAKFDALYGKGYSFRDIMSNPTLNGAWDQIRQKVLGNYEKKLQKTLSDADTRYKNGTLLISDPDQKKAFDLMVDIIGAGGFWDAKAEDRDKRINIAIIAGSALAGTAAAIATAPVSLPGMAGAALLGGGITTVGSMIAKGSIKDGDQAYYDALVELGLNTATFGAGGLIARAGVSAWGSASMITSKYGALAAKSGIAITEGTAGMLLGASIEKTRAQYEGIGLSWTESMKNNFWWAFLPLAIQYKGVFKQQSIDLARRRNNNAERAQVSGPTPAVQAEARAIAAEAEVLAPKVQVEQAVQVQHAPVPATGSRTAPAANNAPAPKPTPSPVAMKRIQQLENSTAGSPYDISNGSIDGYIGKNSEGKFQFTRLDDQKNPKTFNTVNEAHEYMAREGFRFKDEIRIENNMKLSDPERIRQVGEKLGKLSPQQEEALLLAYNTGNTPLNLRAKVDILSREIDGEQLFSTGQRRILIEEGYVGKSQGFQQVAEEISTTRPIPPPAPKPVEPVAPSAPAQPRKPLPENAPQSSNEVHTEYTPTAHGLRGAVHASNTVDVGHLQTMIDKKFKVLKKGESLDIGDLSVTKQTDGKVRVKGKDIDYITTDKDAKGRISSHIAQSQEQYDTLFRGSIKSSVDHWPKGKKAELSHEGNTYTISKSKDGGDVVVTDTNGNVVSGEISDAIFASNAQKVFKLGRDNFLEKHGHEKVFTRVGPDTFIFKQWKEWNGQPVTLLNGVFKLPSKGIRPIAEMTVNELLAPVRTGKAVWDTFTTPGSPLSVGNNALKAIVLRDIEKQWGITSIGSAVLGRGVALSVIPLLTYAPFHKDKDGNMQSTVNTPEALETMAYLFYGGLIGGTLASHLFTDSKPLTWEYGSGNPGAQVSRPAPVAIPVPTVPPASPGGSPPPATVVEGEEVDTPIGT